MEVTDLITQSLRLMGIGMGIVFAFLLLLVGVMRAMSFAVTRFAPEPRAAAAGVGSDRGEAAEDELVAAVSAAVARFRRTRRRPRD